MRQDITFFDLPDNNTGSLTARLSTEAPLVKSIAGENQGRQVQNFSTLVTGLLIAFILGSWKVRTWNVTGMRRACGCASGEEDILDASNPSAWMECACFCAGRSR